MTTPAEPFALYVTSIEGRVVPRYGSPGSYLGVVRAQPNGWTWSQDVQAISHDEYRRFRIEYERAITAGDLKRSTAAAYEASNQARTDKRQGEIDAAKKAIADADAAAKAKAAEEAAAKAAEEAKAAKEAEEAAAAAAAAKAKAEADKASSDGKKKGSDR